MVRESNGSKFMNIITNHINPWPSKTCQWQACFQCNSNEPNSKETASCWTPSLTYRMTCLRCKGEGVKAQYEGESSRSTFTRGAQHTDDFLKQKAGTPLYDHALICHPDTRLEIKDFTMECTGVHRRPTERLMAEGLRIQALLDQQKTGEKPGNKVIIMNSKTNYHQPGIISQENRRLQL